LAPLLSRIDQFPIRPVRVGAAGAEGGACDVGAVATRLAGLAPGTDVAGGGLMAPVAGGNGSPGATDGGDASATLAPGGGGSAVDSTSPAGAGVSGGGAATMSFRGADR